MKKLDGYFPLYWDERSGGDVPRDLTVRYRVPVFNAVSRRASARTTSASIAAPAAAAGAWFYFQRVGPRVMLVQPNQSFRSSSKNPLERKSVEDSFAKSILWGFTVAAESGGRVLVDATDFFLRDVANAATSLRPGNYRARSHAQRVLPAQHAQLPDEHRSRHDADVRQRADRRWRWRWRSDPGPDADRRNRRAGGGGGGGGFGGGLFSGSVGSVTPSPEAVTLREHASFVQLPDHTTFQPRHDDPRAGYGGATFVDYSQPIGEPIQFRYIRRHRLQKKDPNAAISEPVKPIRVLGGLGRAGRRQEGADRRRDVVEPGVRSRGLPQRAQGRGAAGGCRSDGHPLQHDQLGPSLDARLELRRIGVGSAHRRDHQGHGHARLAARSPGLHDLRRPAVALHQRQRAAGGAVRNGAEAHPPAVGARSRPHARSRPQLLRQHQGLDLGDGLPGTRSPS